MSDPAIFGLPPGVDFPAALHSGIMARFGHLPPHELALVEVFVNSARMARRLKEQFLQGGAMLLPRIRLVTDLARDVAMADLPPAVSPLRRRLELTQLIIRLVETDPSIAPRAAVFDLADSLATLLSEMHEEGVAPETIAALQPGDESGHWERALRFVQLTERYFGESSDEPPLPEARQRQVIERLIADWQAHPPAHPIIVAGSTGSRAPTFALMQAVATLPQGAVVLPGFDFDAPADVWSTLRQQTDDPREDHPQYRYAHLLQVAGLDPRDVAPWGEVQPPVPNRNRLVSMALRPAPVTDQWLRDGPNFQGIEAATHGMSLIEAPSPRIEATAIALALREALEQGQSAALITPDRTLSRMVTAALMRWGIEPDDSAGEPLTQSPPGRLLRMVCAAFGHKLTAPDLISLLKHPLTAAGSPLRGQHLLWTRAFEIWLRSDGPAFPTPQTLTQWANLQKDEPEGLADWADWIGQVIAGLSTGGTRPLADHLEQHVILTSQLVCGPNGNPAPLWDQPAGREAWRFVTELQREAGFGGSLHPMDYAELITAAMTRHEVRDPDAPHPAVMIWGTLEARVQGADLVILGGLNDGVWPAMPAPDPWLSRRMRADCGLTSPDSHVGLSAHDFQQAIGARQVILSRAIRDAEAETVPSRWLNRLTNLMGGMSDAGKLALEQMRARGTTYTQWATALDAPSDTDRAENPPAHRPAPCPPADARPRSLSVTAIQRLIRDPYAIYAQRVLGLRAFAPLAKSPDAPLRGEIVHDILEAFINEWPTLAPDDRLPRMQAIAAQILDDQAPWPAHRAVWRIKLERIMPNFIADEARRQSSGAPLITEKSGRMEFPTLGFALTGKADRIDRLNDGTLAIYDYKTGTVPTKNVIEQFDRQLHLEALMAENGAFEDVPPAPVSLVAHIGLGSKDGETPYGIDASVIAETREGLVSLIGEYQNPAKGYQARRAMMKMNYANDFDQLARFGEWDESDLPVSEEVGR